MKNLSALPGETGFRGGLLFLLLFFIIASPKAFSQQTELLQPEKQNFYFDAISFQGVSDTAERVDLFVLVPYQILQFSGSDNFFAAQYRLVISVFDSASGRKIREERVERRLTETNYANTRSGTGNADPVQRVLALPAGTYRIDVLMIDILSKSELLKSRSVNVPAYRKFPFGMSAALLVSSIEQSGSRWSITPHVSDNIGGLTEGFFVFFETYNRATHDSADFVYQLISSKGNIVTTGSRIRQNVREPRAQHYLRVSLPKNVERGNYILRITGLRPSAQQEFSSSDIIALSERSVTVERTVAGFVMTDLDKAIRQLRYAASQSEMSFITEGKSPEEQQERFAEFWKKLDPTPNTQRNEAFEEYYARIEYANRSFRSYSEGWLTDMGMVHIIFGPPGSIDRQNRSDGRQIVRWSYADNRQFIFFDASGFGDFRLSTPVSSQERYRYGR